MRLSRIVWVLCAATFALALVVTAADARVGGKGGSFGSRGTRTYSAPPPTATSPSAAPIQRSITQPNAPGTNVARPATQTGGGLFNRPGGLFGGGLLGGLAAGFIGAGLFGLLFGHGFMGGLGGFASILGLLLQVALVVLVARIAWAWWQRRNQPALAQAGGPQPMFRDMFGAGGGAAAPAAGNGQPAEPADDVGITPADYDAFERLLSEIQVAYGNEDLAALRSRVTPEMLSYFSEDLSANASRGVVNRVSDVKLLQGDLAEAWREGGTEYATVAMRFSLVDQLVDRATDRVVEGGPQPQEVTEVWTFMRARGGNWILSAIQQV